MKKIFTLFVFAFFISQLCVAQEATLLENSEHKMVGNFGTYLGRDDNHIYYEHTYALSSYFVVSDNKGNCIVNSELGLAFVKMRKNKNITQSYFLEYVNFKGKLFVIYELIEKTQKEGMLQKNYVPSETHTVYAFEYPSNEIFDLSNSIIISKVVKDPEIKHPFFYDTPLIYISEDSTKLAVISLGHFTVLNEKFEKLNEGEMNFLSPNDKSWYLSRCIFTGDKLLFVLGEMKDKSFVLNGLNGIGEISGFKIWTYDIENHQAKYIDIPSSKELFIPNDRIVWTWTDSNHNTVYKYTSCSNYRYKNGILYLFGKVISEGADHYLAGLAYLNIDIEKATCKIKYVNAGGEKYSALKISTAGIKFCADESVMVYNNYFGVPNDTLECIKFDKEMNIIWRKKTPTVEPKQNSYSNSGFCFINNKLGFIYIKSNTGDMKDLVKVDFDEENGNTISQTVYQYNQKDYEPSFVVFEALDENNLFLEMCGKKTGKFLKLPF